MPEDFAQNINTEDKIEIKAAVSGLNDLTMQKKAFMSLVASNVLCKYLREQNIKIVSENNNISGVLLLKDFDLANIIVENNIKIAVSAFVGDVYPQMCIPKSHFVNDILADIYVGIRLETAIDKAEFVGFIEADKINRQNGNNKYISIGVDQLKSIDILKTAINALGKGKTSYFALDHEKAEELFFQYIESRISSSDKEFFARHIASCTQCSQKFNYIVEIDNMIKGVGDKFDFEEKDIDYTLKLFSGDSSLMGEEIEIDLKEKDEELREINIINQKVLGQRKNKHIFKRKTGKVLNAVGKLALVSGAAIGSSQILSAMHTASVAGLAGNAALSMAIPVAKGIVEGLSSVSGYSDSSFGNEDLSSKEKSFKSEETAEDSEFVFDEEEYNKDNIELEEVSLLSEETAEDSEFVFDEEVVSLHNETLQVENMFSEVQHKDVSEEVLSLNKEEIETNFDDLSVDYDIDDFLNSFDTVEVVDSTDDLFTLDSTELEPDSEFVAGENSLADEKLNKEQAENIINEIYEQNETIPVEYQGMNFDNDNLSDENSIVEDEEEYDFEEEIDELNEAEVKKNNLRSIDKKLAAGITAASIAAAVAIAFWINNKPSINQNLPIGNSQPINQVSSLPPPAGTENQNPSNNLVSPVDNSAKQPEPIKAQPKLREPMRSYQKSNTPPPSKDLSAVLAEAFSRRTYEVDIRNISWEITADMAQNPIYKNYIMVTGQALKSALGRDLAMANERALNTQMEIKTVMDLNGNILEANVIQSSGSNEVDKICLDTYKTTIQFTKLPKINVNRDKIKANLIISF